MSDDLEGRIRDWWNQNPFSYGLSRRDSYQDVGDIPDEALNGRFFDRYMRKVRKQHGRSDSASGTIASQFIPYSRMRAKRVLDVACGMGWATVEMANQGAIVTGIDISPRVIEIARRHLEHRGLASSASVQVMDAQSLQFDAGTFDFVNAWGCLMHMPRTERALAEIFRVLKPGGQAIGYMYNKDSVTYWWHIWFLRGVLLGGLVRYSGSAERLVSRYTDGITLGGNPHTKVYNPQQAKALFEAAGFRNVRVKPWGPPTTLDGFPISKLPLGRLLPYPIKKAISDRWGWGLVFSADKPE